MKKETIGILICTLLISVAVAPAINALDNEVDIVKEPTDTFGLTDTGSWEQTVNDLLARFEAAQTQESKIALLEEIPIVMDIHGLLPEDMTVEEAQELIVSAYLETIASSSLQTDEQFSVAGDSPLVVSKSVVHSTLPQYQVSESNRIVNHNIKLITPWPPYDKRVWFGFGRISNLQHGYAGWEPYYSFNCENVICSTNGLLRWHHYTNGEELYIVGPYVGIITDKFIFVLPI